MCIGACGAPSIGGFSRCSMVSEKRFVACVVVFRDREVRRARLLVPQRKLRQVRAGRILERLDELLDCRRFAVVAVEIEIEPFAEAILAEDRADHPHHFGAFFVNRRRVEVVDLRIAPRPHRMGQRAGVFGELVRLQELHLGDALDRARAHVGGEFMVAEDGQPFLQAELEPVAASDSVTGPIVEILVRDDRFDIGVIGIGGGALVGEHVFVVEDVEALVFHRPHVEVRDGDDHEHVEVVFAPEGLLVPFQRALQRVHSVVRARLLAVFDIDFQLYVAPRHRRETVAHHTEIAGDQREQIGRLGVGVVPDRVVPAVFQNAVLDAVAVRQQQRRILHARLDAHRVDRQNVRPVEEIGDAAEALRLALRAIGAGRAVEPHQLLVGRRDPASSRSPR
jgi:hypothetical protein